MRGLRSAAAQPVGSFAGLQTQLKIGNEVGKIGDSLQNGILIGLAIGVMGGVALTV